MKKEKVIESGLLFDDKKNKWIRYALTDKKRVFKKLADREWKEIDIFNEFPIKKGEL